MRDRTPRDAGSPDTVRDWAESGVVAVTGYADGPPVVPPGVAATRARELARWVSAAAGSIEIDGARLLAERAALTKHGRRGTVSVGGGCRLLPTADGWAAVSCVRPDDPLLLGALIGQDIESDDPWPPIAGWLGAHSGAELAERAELLGIAARPVDDGPCSNPVNPIAPRSVEGFLVVDFSALWAGPLCAHLLGRAGARIVKVETPNRPDGARRGNPEFYDLLHHGHESVVLDPSEPGGRRALGRLVEAADIVIEASRPRALAGFGLDAHATVARGATWVSITAAGRKSDRVGFGDDIAAGAGLVAAGVRGAPVFVGDAIADPLAGLTAAALAMSTPPSVGGVLLDVSMSDVVAATLGDAPVAVPRRDGDTWIVDCATGSVPIAEPTARTPGGTAAPAGADTARVLASLGIPAP
ncbi:CoA transferase [Nocardia arizonensis]|uniref:CoA transferase n=1 Tax=Nocardia arizonensis TaxID=1141647 RepID=UPI0006CFCC0B|nr:CoA transferase [Nocardia arizonensis]